METKIEEMQQDGDNWKKEGRVIKGGRNSGQSEHRLDVLYESPGS